ncbi:DMT family transporter [Micrococcoides hystricis]|uniref:DMT family transporter n=1 Tax=Micrococcoides hystricis TaxID=1572761 RepID=A0ABV6P8Q9_9MICC
MLLPILAAVGSAIALAIGTHQQAKAARLNAAEISLRRRGWLVLLTQPRWLIGLLIQLVAIALSVWALSRAPLTIVQPIGALSLVVTTLLNSWDQKMKLPAATWWGSTLAVAGSLGFVFVAIGAVHQDQVVTVTQETKTIVTALALAVFSLALYLVYRKNPHALLLVVISGILYGFVAVLIRVLMLRVDFGAPDWWQKLPWLLILTLLVTAGFGWFLVQQAYLHGPPDLVIAGLTVIDPMVGVLIGIILLNELKVTTLSMAHVGMVVLAAVAIVGVFVLAKSHPQMARVAPVGNKETQAK